MRIANIDPLGEIAISLLRDAAVEIRALYAHLSPEPMPAPTNDPLGIRDLYIAAFLSGTPAACGALREFDRTTAEVRRMYVRPEHRRKHVGQAIFTRLIGGARQLGYERIILETGNRQAPAISFYKNLGFTLIAPFGEHVSDVTSLCYALHIEGARQGPPAV